MLKALRRFTQLLRVHIYVPGCCKYIRMTNGLQPLVELCMDGCFADEADLGFSNFADAAFLCAFGKSLTNPYSRTAGPWTGPPLSQGPASRTTGLYY